VGKTKPIGVRFDEELLNKVKGASLATSPQKALNLYERSYVELIEMKVAENNKPENKERIERERNTVSEVSKNSQHKQPLTEAECTPNPPTTLDEQELKKKIEAIRAEKIPEHRNRSTLGKKSWEAEQKQRILEIQEQINSLK